jgi:hypothetical protein
LNYKRIIIVIAALFLLNVITAGAEEKFGVQVYSGAKFDAAVSKTVSEFTSANAACYRTNDSVAKVAEFYKKQTKMEYTRGEKVAAAFTNGQVDVTIQNPWMDTKTGKMMTDTLIMIVKHD